MAVFTKLLKEDIENFISDYAIGNLERFEEIIDGIENSNFKIFCNNQPYILTIFEKRVTEQELPFFINLKNFLNKHNFKCPKAISDKNGKILKRIKNKTAVIISFLEGKSIEEIMDNLDMSNSALRNNGGGYYNHSLFWKVISPIDKGELTGELKQAIMNEFGSLDGFKSTFSKLFIRSIVSVKKCPDPVKTQAHLFSIFLFIKV